MGMKTNSHMFSGTSGAMKYGLNIQYFASKIFSKNGHVSEESLRKHGQDLLGKTPIQVKGMMNEAGYECSIRPGRKTATVVISTNPSKNRNITQVQISPDGSAHHGSNPYVKVSTKDIGVLKIVEGTSKTYKKNNEKALVIFKRRRRSK